MDNSVPVRVALESQGGAALRPSAAIRRRQLREALIAAGVTAVAATGIAAVVLILVFVGREALPVFFSPKVHAENFTPGAISMILCVVSRRMVFTGDGSSGLSSDVKLSASPTAKAPVWRSLLNVLPIAACYSLAMPFIFSRQPAALA